MFDQFNNKFLNSPSVSIMCEKGLVQYLFQLISRAVQNILRVASVGIMGLGGLGSAVCLSLARLGIGRLRICDHDCVDLSNIHRQQYFLDQIGQPKTEALAATMRRINPFLRIETIEKRLTESSITRYFADVDVLIECFDDPAMKAAALRGALKKSPRIGYVGASGLSGFGPANTIYTRCLRPGIYLVGDGESGLDKGESLTAPRVGVAAQHQANQAVRLLLGLTDPP